VIGLFKKKPKRRAIKALPEEELARRLIAPGYRCALSGEVLDAPHAIRMPGPFGWPDPPAPQPDDKLEELSGQGDLLTENYARRNRDWLLRANLPILVSGTDGHVFLGIWASLPLGNHARFRSAQSRGDAETLGDLPSWLYTRLPPESGPLLTKGVIVPVPDGAVPYFWIMDQKHPLYAAQQEGMSATDLLDLYVALGAGDLVDRLRA